MSPDQDPTKNPTNESDVDSAATQPPAETLDTTSPAPTEPDTPSVGSTDTTENQELKVDESGFVSEPSPTDIENKEVAIDGQEPFQQQPIIAGTPKKKNSKKLLLIVGGIVVALLLAGTAVFAFWHNNPDKAVADAFAHLMRTESGTVKGSASIVTSGAGGGDYKLDYVSAVNDTSFSLDGSLEATLDGTTSTVEASIVASQDAFGIKVANFREIVEAGIKESGLDASALSMYDGLIALIDDKWVVITKDDLKGFTQDQEADEQLTCAQDALKTFRSDGGQQQEVRRAYEQNRFLIAKANGSESVNGKQSNRYLLTVDEAKAKTFATALTETTVFKALDDCYDSDLKEQFTKVEDEAVDAEQDTTSSFELWVDMWSHEPTKFEYKISDDEASGTFVGTIELNNADEITVPEADTTLEDLQTELMNTMMRAYQSDSPYTVDRPVLGINTFSL